MNRLLRLAALAAATALLGACAHGDHPYSATSAQGNELQAYWRDFSGNREQAALWREDNERQRQVRMRRVLDSFN